MKHFIAICIFAIGLMVSLPAASSGSKAPPGQVSFEVGLIDVAPAIEIVQAPVFVSIFNQLAPVAEMVQEKGGAAIGKSLNTYRATGLSNKNVIVTATESSMFNNHDFRICRYTKHEESQIITQNIESPHRCTIRADSQA
ncbi:MAG: hypothetical protein A2066_12755 [Bacteroidetes bacterium GWB2_41_8]|nr:MAG: hypothetical protein A2066_12755 [Bacteroidetes bacterium GWB2_41_8]